MTKPKVINSKKLVAFVLLICKIKLPLQFTNRVCRYLYMRTGCENQLDSGLKWIVRREYRVRSSLCKSTGNGASYKKRRQLKNGNRKFMKRDEIKPLIRHSLRCATFSTGEKAKPQSGFSEKCNEIAF